MAGGGFLSRIPKRFVKTVTFTATGDGAIGTVTLGTLTERAMLVYVSAACTTTLTSGGAPTIEVGTANNTAGILPQIVDGTDLVALKYWRDATPEVEVSPAVINLNVQANIILTVGTATVTAGVIEFVFFWLPMSNNGQIA